MWKLTLKPQKLGTNPLEFPWIGAAFIIAARDPDEGFHENQDFCRIVRDNDGQFLALIAWAAG
jgi:hypothetical protein